MNGSNHVYYFYWNACEIDGYVDFSGTIQFSFWISNSDGTNQGRTLDPESVTIAKANCLQSRYLPMFETPFLYCCGRVLVTVLIGQDDDPNNNAANDNNPHAAMYADTTESIRANVMNFANSAKTFVNTVDATTVPSGWTVDVNVCSLEIPAGQERRFTITIHSPDSVTVWPDVDVWSNSSATPSLNQLTRVTVRDDATNDDDPCVH